MRKLNERADKISVAVLVARAAISRLTAAAATAAGDVKVRNSKGGVEQKPERFTAPLLHPLFGLGWGGQSNSKKGHRDTETGKLKR